MLRKEKELQTLVSQGQAFEAVEEFYADMKSIRFIHILSLLQVVKQLLFFLLETQQAKQPVGLKR